MMEQVLVPVEEKQQQSQQFRSVLPHEPIITPYRKKENYNDKDKDKNKNNYCCSDDDNNEKYGYIILQGSLEPKVTAATTATTTTTTTVLVHTPAITPQAPSTSTTKDKVYYWTNHKSLENSIKRILVVDQYCSNSDNDKEEQQQLIEEKDDDSFIYRKIRNRLLPKCFRNNTIDPIIKDIKIITESPPYSKIRITLSTSYYASILVQRWKRYNICPADILFMNDDSNTNTITPPPTTSTTTTKLSFSTRPFQITQITLTPLPIPSAATAIIHNNSNNNINSSTSNENSDNNIDCCWRRSNPPKFHTRISPILLSSTTSRTGNNHNNNIIQTRFLRFETKLNVNTILASVSTKDMDNLTIDPIKIVQYIQHNSFVFQQMIRSIFNQYDTTNDKLGIEVFVESKKGIVQFEQVYIGMRSYTDAQIVLQSIQGKFLNYTLQYYSSDLDSNSDDDNDVDQDSDEPTNNTCIEQSITISSSQPIFVDYAIPINPPNTNTNNSSTNDNTTTKTSNTTTSSIGIPTRSECTSITSTVQIPGLVVIENFISCTDEEDVLMAVLTGPHAPWAPPQPTASNPNASIKRSVQHYGYTFDYQTNSIHIPNNKNTTDNGNNTNSISSTSTGNSCSKDDNMTETNVPVVILPPPMPSLPNDVINNPSSITENHLQDITASYIQEGRGWELLGAVVERVRRYQLIDESEKQYTTNGKEMLNDCNTLPKSLFTTINQMTVNQYKPGQGIGWHVETIPDFADGLISISLNSGIVMEFRRVGSDEQTLSNYDTTGNSHSTDDDRLLHAQEESSSDTSNNTSKNNKKLVYLPPRSAILLYGEARYQWEHSIVTRMTDTHNGQVLPRQLRISLTLRTAVDPNNGLPLPLLRSNHFPPVLQYLSNSSSFTTDKTKNDNTTQLSNENNTSIGKKSLKTPACEREHVHAVYDAIAVQWNHTRGKRGVLWPGATKFLQSYVSSGSIIADVGCGDGKYFPVIWESGSYVIGTDISEPLLRTALQQSNDTKSSPFPSEKVSNNSSVDIEKDIRHTAGTTKIPDIMKVSEQHSYLQDHPAVVVGDCINIPLRTSCCDGAICIAVLHHLSTFERRVRCMEELVRIVKPGGLINVQAWAMEQDGNSRRKFPSNDVFVPFNAQPKYLQLPQQNESREDITTQSTTGSNNGNVDKIVSTTKTSNPSNTVADVSYKTGKSTAQVYANAFKNTEYDERKGLVVFQRYCHLYRKGELEDVASYVSGLSIIDSGFECGNYFIILKVTKGS